MPMDADAKMAADLQAKLRSQGVAVSARFEPAEDESVDDQIAFTTPDGTGQYPVVVQLSGRTLSVVIHEFDAKGQLDSVLHGPMHRQFDDKMVGELAQKLRDNAPRPVPDADPAPPGMRR